MSELEERLPKPAEPPRVQRRLRLHPHQWIGIPILFLAPVILALIGFFGEQWDTVNVETEEFAATVHFPDRFRYKQLNSIRIAIESRSLVPVDTITVSVDTAYANRFSTVRGIPSLSRPYQLELTGMRPGDRQSAIIEIQAEHYGIHTGELTIAARRDTARLRLRTTVFP